MAHTFGTVSEGLGEYAGWALQGAPVVTEVDRINVLDSTGNEAGDDTFDTRYRLTQTYKAISAASTIPTDFQSIGNTVDGWIILGINFSTDAADYVTMVITALKLVDGTTNGTVRTVAHNMSLDSGRGCSLWGCTAAETNGGASSSCNIVCDIELPKGGTGGNTIAAQTYNPRIEISVTCTGGVTIASGFTQTGKTVDKVNVEFQKTTVEGTKALAFT